MTGPYLIAEDIAVQEGFSNVSQTDPLSFSIERKNYTKFMNFVDKFDLTSSCEFQFNTFKKEEKKIYFLNKIKEDFETIYNGSGIAFSIKCYYIFMKDYIIRFNITSYEKYKTLYFKVHFNNNSYSAEELEEITKNKILDDIDEVSSVDIKWYYSTNGSVSTSYFEEIVDDNILNEAYPFVNNMSEYIEDFLNSNETILLLFGDPGTGKTRFIRYLMKKLNNKYKDSNTLYTTDAQVLEKDEMFLSFIQNNSNRLLILEDIDHNLKSRISGNVFMYKLLSSSDGIIQHNNKKIVLSTNLTTLEDIDEALLREGRCYDIINFRKLTLKESRLFLAKFDIMEKKLDKESYSLAELYTIVNKKSIKKNSMIMKKVGFE